MSERDGGRTDDPYRNLFTHPRMVADLLRGYLREPWVERLDLGSLEPRGEPRAAEHLERPERGLAWRVRWGEGEGWIHLLLELPRAVEPFMALRMSVRIALLHQDLVRTGEIARPRRLPWAVPIVLYDGAEPWTASRELADLIDPPPRGAHWGERYRPRQRHLLLDARREPLPSAAAPENLAALLFALARCGDPGTLDGLVARLVWLLPGPGQARLRRTFAAYLRGALLPERFPGIEIPSLAALDLPAPRKGFAGLAPEEPDRARQRRDEAALLLRLLERKFGPLPPAERARIETAERERILGWWERLVTARTLAETLAETLDKAVSGAGS